MRKVRFNLVAPVLALVLLSLLAAETFSRPQPSDSEPYHAAVRHAGTLIPQQFGDWVGHDQKSSVDAERLLKPNIIFSRNYINRQNGRVVGVLIVHCKDARSLEGHYPPVCYPSSGYTALTTKERQWHLASTTVPGMEYKFGKGPPEPGELLVYNFLILPPKYDKSGAKQEEGAYVPDMKGVNRNAWDYLRRYFGAAQVQVVYRDPQITADEREAIFQEMVRVHMPLIEAIRSGAKQ